MNKVGKMTNNSGEKNAISSHGKLGHEIFEQFLKQIHGIKDYDETENGAHIQAYRFEDQVNGVERQAGDESVKVNPRNPNIGVATFRYKVSNGTIVNIKYTYDATEGKGVKIYSVTQSKN